MKKSFLLSGLLFFAVIMPSFASIEDDATVLYNKGIDLYEQDKIEQSIATFKKAISISPDFYEAYYNLARIQEASGKYQDAINSYEALLKIQPDDYESAYQLSELLFKKGYLSKAATYLNKIPSNSEYGTKATVLQNKISKRQNELAQESKIKAQQSLKTSIVGSVPAPSGLVIDSESNMYVASFSENKIFKISKDGLTKTVFADGTKEVSGPIGLAIDPYDNLYAANYNKGSVVMYDKNGNHTVLMYAKKPYCISLDEKKAKIYITEQQNNSVVSYDVSDIFKMSAAKKQASVEQNQGIPAEVKEQKVIEVPAKDKTPLGVPSIIESNFTRTNPQNSVTSPIMIPSNSLFDY